MRIVAFFTEDGAPKTGLTPSISILNLGTDTVAASGTMSELTNMIVYSYNFAGYDEDNDYAILIDGGATLTGSERYLFSANVRNNLEQGQTTAQADLDNPNQYKADVSLLALEANVQGYAAAALTAYDPPTRAEATADKDEIIVEVDANETKIDSLQTDMTTALADILIVKKVETGRWKISGTQMIFYDDDETTPLYTFDLKDINGNAANRNVFERILA